MSLLNSHTKLQIALLAGDDLEGAEAGETRGQVESCPDCRRHWTRVRGCLDVLHRTDSGVRPAGSLWPAIEDRLLATSQPLRPRRSRAWIPVFSIAAACLAVALAATTDRPGSVDSWSGDAATASAGGRAVTSVRFEESEPRRDASRAEEWVRGSDAADPDGRPREFRSHAGLQ